MLTRKSPPAASAGGLSKWPPAPVTGAILGLAGFALNTTPITLGFGVDALLGPLAVYVSILLFGARAGVTAGIIAPAYTIVLWGHPWAWPIMSLEAIVVAWAWNRGVPLILAVACYWMFLGIPLVLALYSGILELPSDVTWLIAVKQSLNAFALASLASVASPFLHFATQRKVYLADIYAGTAMSLVLVPALVLTQWHSARAYDAMLENCSGLSTQQARDIGRLVDDHLRREIDQLVHVAARYKEVSGEHSFGTIPADYFKTSYHVTPLSVQYRLLKDRDSGTQPISSASASTIAPGARGDAKYIESATHARLVDEGETIELTATEPLGDSHLHVRALYRTNELIDSVANVEWPGSGHRHGDLFTIRIDSEPAEKIRFSGKSLDFREFELQKVQAGPSVVDVMLKKSATSEIQAWSQGYLLGSVSPIEQLPSVEIQVWKSMGDAINDYRAMQNQALQLALVIALVCVCFVVFGTRALSRSFIDFGVFTRQIGHPGHRSQRLQRYRNIVELETVETAIADTHALVQTERKRRNQLQKQLNFLLKNAPTLMFAMQRDGTGEWAVVFRGPKGARTEIFDPRIQEVFPDCLDAIHSEDHEKVDQAWRLFLGRGNASVECRVKTTADKFVWVRLEVAVTDLSKNRAIWSVTDIQENRLAAEQLASSARLITLGEMATGLAHEINQPLNTIRLAAENSMAWIGDRDLDTETQGYLEKKLVRISQQTDRASNIVKQMRIFGRQPDDLPVEFNIVNAIEDAIDIVSPRLRMCETELKFDASGFASITAIGHQQLLEQVIINLVSNANDAINSSQAERSEPSSGHIDVTIAVNPVDRSAIISVRDNGGGIPEDVRPRMFDPFFTTKDVNKGTGLGLAICFGIVTEMGGTIEAQNLSGGAVLDVTIPIVCAVHESETAAADIADSGPVG